MSDSFEIPYFLYGYINKIQWLSQNETGESGFKAIGLCFSFIFLFPNGGHEPRRHKPLRKSARRYSAAVSIHLLSPPYCIPS